jgi:hypothetical protein
MNSSVQGIRYGDSHSLCVMNAMPPLPSKARFVRFRAYPCSVLSCCAR